MKRITGTYQGRQFIGVVMLRSLNEIRVLLSKESARLYGRNILIINRNKI